MNNYTNFISKALTLSEKLHPEIRNKEKRLSFISGEKVSTVKNWLFQNKTPVAAKRLMISDRFGVSEESLFGDGHEINIPIAIYNEELNFYIVPQVNEVDIDLIILNKPPLLVIDRIPLKLNKLAQNDVIELNKTYCIKLLNLSFPPFILSDDMIFINPSMQRKRNGFYIYKTATSAEIVKIKVIDGERVMYNKKGKELLSIDSACIIPILLVLTEGCQSDI